LLELKTARLAALRRTEDDLTEMQEALDAYKEKVLNGKDAVQEDLLFHLAIAKASGNSSMNTFMLIITPEIITNFEKYHVCDTGLSQEGIQEHQAIFDAIKSQDPQVAKQKMKDHFKVLYQYCYSIK
jgi:GntR family transcriptional repressor for pyruvate dehydrogenase complex